MGVEQTTPSPPQRDSGRPSISMITSITRSRAAFSTVASFSAQVDAMTCPVAAHGHVDRHPLLDRVVPRHHPLDQVGQPVRFGLGEEPDVAEVRPDQRHRGGPGEFGGAQQAAVAAEDDDELGALGGRGAGRDLAARPGR